MSFSTDIKHVMTNDPSLNAWCTGGIYFENLPENFELTKYWIVYSFNKVSQTNCLDSNAAFTQYVITLKIIGTDTIQVESINDKIVNYLNGIEYNGIKDILFVGDNHTLDLEKNIYMNTLTFNSLFV